jgi:hypothetical protein
VLGKNPVYPATLERGEIACPSQDVKLIFIRKNQVLAENPFSPDNIGCQKGVRLVQYNKIDSLNP